MLFSGFLFRDADCVLCGRERDTTIQLIGDIDEVIPIVIELVNGSMDWPEACQRLSIYEGVQSLE